MPQQPSKPLTMQDIINSDPRVQALKKQFESTGQQRNQIIFKRKFIIWNVEKWD